MKKWLHKKLDLHNWEFNKEVKNNVRGGGDYLPEDIKVFQCNCGAIRKEITPVFTHFGGETLIEIEL